MDSSITSIEGNEPAYGLIIVFCLNSLSSVESLRYWIKVVSWETQLLPKTFYPNAFNTKEMC